VGKIAVDRVLRHVRQWLVSGACVRGFESCQGEGRVLSLIPRSLLLAFLGADDGCGVPCVTRLRAWHSPWRSVPHQCGGGQ
jgi:hypothetical protein